VGRKGCIEGSYRVWEGGHISGGVYHERKGVLGRTVVERGGGRGQSVASEKEGKWGKGKVSNIDQTRHLLKKPMSCRVTPCLIVCDWQLGWHQGALEKEKSNRELIGGAKKRVREGLIWFQLTLRAVKTLNLGDQKLNRQ